MYKALLTFLFLPILSFAQSQDASGKVRFSIYLQPEANSINLAPKSHLDKAQSDWTLGFNIGGKVQLKLMEGLYFRTAVAVGERSYNLVEHIKKEFNTQEQALLHTHDFTLETFDLNIGLAYDFISFDKITLSLSSGIGYQVYENLSRQSILEILSSGEILDIEEFSGATPNDNYSMTAFAAINLAYKIGKNFHLIFEPTYSFNIQPLQLEGLTGDRFQNLAFLLGIRFEIGQ